MKRKSFLENGDRLYLVKGKQLVSITEDKQTTLFLFLEANWQRILNERKKLKTTPIFQFNLKAYKALAGDLTKDSYCV